MRTTVRVLLSLTLLGLVLIYTPRPVDPPWVVWVQLNNRWIEIGQWLSVGG